MSETGYVYTLNDPRTGEPKYVGATKDPRTRLYGHEHGATNDNVIEWINELEQEDLSPEMTLVEVTDLDELSDAEQTVIARLSEEWELLNGKHSTPYSTSENQSKGGKNPLIRVPEPLKEKAETVQDKHDFATIGEAVRHMCQTGGYDV